MAQSMLLSCIILFLASFRVLCIMNVEAGSGNEAGSALENGPRDNRAGLRPARFAWLIGTVLPSTSSWSTLQNNATNWDKRDYANIP